MPGFKPFLAGMLAGGCLAAGALQYHVVRSDEGMFLVPRSPKPSLTLAYADTRRWDDEQWNRYPALVNALKANGASDLLNGDEKMSLNEIQDAMQASLNGAAPFELDGVSDFTANKPSPESIRDTIDRIPHGTAQPANRDGFLNDVRQELNRSFDDKSFSSNRSTATPSSDYDALRDARDRMKSTIDDSLDYDAFSESLDDFGSATSRTIESDQPYSHFEPAEIRRRSFDSDANQGEDEGSISAPDFDDDDDILNRFAPRSGAADQSTTLTYDDGWAADPWAQASPSIRQAGKSAVDQVTSRQSAIEAETPGWTATKRNETTDNGLVSGVIDRLKKSAGDVASDSMERTRAAVTNPLESTFNDARDRALGAVSESVKDRTKSATDMLGESLGGALRPDSEDLFSPFGELFE